MALTELSKRVQCARPVRTSALLDGWVEMLQVSDVSSPWKWDDDSHELLRWGVTKPFPDVKPNPGFGMFLFHGVPYVS